VTRSEHARERALELGFSLDEVVTCVAHRSRAESTDAVYDALVDVRVVRS